MTAGQGREAWSAQFGGVGCFVTVTTRPGSPWLYLRWWNADRDNWQWKSLRHADRERGQHEAMALATALLRAHEAADAGVLTLAALFATFTDKVVRHEDRVQRVEDERRMDIWRAALDPLTDVNAVDRSDLDAFVRQRRAGTLTVPGRVLRANPTERTIGADVEFLRRVYNWASTVMDDAKPGDAAGRRKPLTTHQPVRNYAIPATPNPARPLATYDRWLAVRAVADAVDPQALFGGFMDVIEGLGWRVSGVASLRRDDVDLAAHDEAPYGQIHKRAGADKSGMDMWVPLSRGLRSALARLLKARARLDVDSPWLFPAPRTEGPWSRFHARAVLSRAEAEADLLPIKGGDFHPYRRAWASAREHLPRKAVAQAGAWKGTRMVDLYTQAQPGTVLAVVSDRKKVRAIRPAANRQTDPKRSKHRSTASKGKWRARR